MADDKPFRTQFEYEIALLRLLAKLPGGRGSTDDVCRRFEKEYQHRIPDKDRGERSDGNEIWNNNVRWCRNYLKQRGLLDGSQRGIWQITQEGRRWLEENPNATRIPGTPPRPEKKGGRKSPTRSQRPKSEATVSPRFTFEMLEKLRESIPADMFQEMFGEEYAQLLALERAKVITEIDQRELGRRAQSCLDEIHAFLRGQSANAPSAQKLCNWILFCHSLDLYREIPALFQYVRQDEISPGIYQWVKKAVDTYRTKLPG